MTTSNIKDAGWFCHAPNKQRIHQEVALPPTSQIPGLSDLPPEYPSAEDNKKMLFKDTDTKYITLCKMGGRPDLLRIPSPKPKTNEAKPYRTVDWYYIEDIRKEEADKKDHEQYQDEHYEPLLPDYMVHREYAPHGNPSHQPGRNPFSRDNTNVFQREGNSATSKTVKIDEPVPKGYGVRNEKAFGKKVNMPAMPKYQRAKGHKSELDQEKQYAKPMNVTAEDKPMMSKILSFGYQKEWEKEHDKWQQDQEDLRQQQYASVMHPGKHEKAQSEYQSQMEANAKKSHGVERKERVPSHGRRAPSGGSTASHRRTKTHIEPEQPAFFSLPRYENGSANQNENNIEPMKYDPIRHLSSVEGRK